MTAMQRALTEDEVRSVWTADLPTWRAIRVALDPYRVVPRFGAALHNPMYRNRFALDETGQVRYQAERTSVGSAAAPRTGTRRGWPASGGQRRLEPTPARAQSPVPGPSTAPSGELDAGTANRKKRKYATKLAAALASHARAPSLPTVVEGRAEDTAGAATDAVDEFPPDDAPGGPFDPFLFSRTAGAGMEEETDRGADQAADATRQTTLRDAREEGGRSSEERVNAGDRDRVAEHEGGA